MNKIFFRDNDLGHFEFTTWREKFRSTVLSGDRNLVSGVFLDENVPTK